MSTVPAQPKVYHITHVRNLAGIVEAGVLWSDARRVTMALDCEVVGMSSIKERRLALPVACHAGTKVGEYVPFNFCPRSIMLYILYMGDHPQLSYRGGQQPVLHLAADLRGVVAWADDHDVPWAFSDRNARSQFASFYCDLVDLDKVDWGAVQARDFRDMKVKEGKQAEFLVRNSFPWELVERVGVFDERVTREVNAALADGSHRPTVAVERTWYY